MGMRATVMYFVVSYTWEWCWCAREKSCRSMSRCYSHVEYNYLPSPTCPIWEPLSYALPTALVWRLSLCAWTKSSKYCSGLLDLSTPLDMKREVFVKAVGFWMLNSERCNQPLFPTYIVWSSFRCKLQRKPTNAHRMRYHREWTFSVASQKLTGLVLYAGSGALSQT